MKNTLALLRELKKEAHYISAHEADPFLQHKARRICRTIEDIKRLLDPPKTGKALDLDKFL